MQNKEKIKLMWWVLCCSTALMLIKFLAYTSTHSNAILTDALESIINVAAGAFALFSVYYSSKPKDQDHPYGHGKIEFMSAGFEGGLIFGAGILMVYKGIRAFWHPIAIHSVDVGLYLSAFGAIVNFLLGMFLVKTGKSKSSSLMVANGKHLLSDTYSSIGLVIGLILIYFTHLYWLDHVITILFGLLIFYTGFKLLRESVNNLLDEADYEKLGHLADLLNKHRHAKWIDIHNLRVLKYGPHLHVDCHVTLPWYQNLEASHEEVNKIERLLQKHTSGEMEIFIHSDPCIPSSCSICTVENCLHRKHAFEKKLNWTIANMIPNQKHSL